MIDDQFVLRIERLRDEVELLKAKIRDAYSSKERSVIAPQLREIAATLAERWLVEVAGDPMVVSAIGEEIVAERSVHFQRLLTYSERRTIRKKYDKSISAILRQFRALIVIPLKAHRQSQNTPEQTRPIAIIERSIRESSIVFIGQSFTPTDKILNENIKRLFQSLGFKVLTGEKPKADFVSKKVKERIDKAHLFVGIFSKRDKLEGRNEWATSAWVIDEKAYAVAKNKKLVLLREQGVNSIGGLQGDYEYLEFDRNDIADLLIRLVELYSTS